MKESSNQYSYKKNTTIVVACKLSKFGSYSTTIISQTQRSSWIQHLLLKEQNVLSLDQYETITQLFRQYKILNDKDSVKCFIPDNPTWSHEWNTSIYKNDWVRNNDVFMSSEGFYHRGVDLQRMKNFVLFGWVHPQIIMNYLRYYDLILSFHNQASKVQEPPSRVPIVEYVNRPFRKKIRNVTDPLD